MLHPRRGWSPQETRYDSVLLGDGAESYKTLDRTDNSANEYEVELQTTAELDPAPERRTTTYNVLKSADGSMVRKKTLPNGSEQKVEIFADDVRKLTEPDKTVTLVTRGPDPRFGMMSPVAEQVVVTTPVGLLQTVVSEVRTATPADPSQPLDTWERTITIQGIGGGDDRVYTMLYDEDGGPSGGPVVTETSPLGRVRRTFLDSDGRVVGSEIDGLEAVTLVYPAGLLEWIRQGPSDEREFGITYDSDLRLQTITSRISSVPDVTETVTFGVFDGGNRPESVTLPDSSVLGLTYDENGNLQTLTPPGQPMHEFEYNRVNLGNLYIPPPVPLVSNPAVNSATNTATDYDFARELDVLTRPDGGTVDREFDPVSGQLTTVVLPPGQGDLEYGYDGLTGQVKTITGPEPGANRPVVEFSYDGFLRTSTRWTCESDLDPLWTDPCEPGTVEATVTEVYDHNFRRISQTVGGVAVTFEYDDDDLLETAGDLDLERAPGPANPGDPLDPDFSHGGIMGSTLGAVEDTYSYSGYGEIATYTVVETSTGDEIFEATVLARDALGRIVTKTEQLEEGPLYEYTYDYDSRGRLDLVTITENGSPHGAEDYEYDANGNRTVAPNLSGPIAVEYDDQDRLCFYEDTTYLYSESGDLLQKTENATGDIGCAKPGTGDTTDYLYDALGNLREVTFPDGTTVQYLVDGLGRRIGKQVRNSGETEFTFKQGFVYESQLRIVAELDEFGAIKSRFVYGERPNVPEYMIQGTDTYRIVTDYLGSVRFVVDTSDGTVVQRMEYDSLGRILPGKDTSPGFQPFGFAGGLYDVGIASLPGTGFLRFGTRDYDPETGRWMAKDRIGFRGGTANLYEYVAGDPINLADRTGEGPVSALLVGVFCGGVAAGGQINDLVGGGDAVDATAGLRDQLNRIDKRISDPSCPLDEQAKLREMRKEVEKAIAQVANFAARNTSTVGDGAALEVGCGVAALAAGFSSALP